MTTMQAAVVHAFGKDLTIDNVPVPTPGQGQALVKLISSGVCHTDLHAVEGDRGAEALADAGEIQARSGHAI